MQRRCYTAAAFELLHLHRKVCQNKQLITVDKHKDKQQICTSLAVLKMHDHMSVIFAKTICACILPSSVRAYKLFSIVYFTNPQLVKYSTFFQFQTLIIIANVLIFTGFGPPPINSAVSTASQLIASLSLSFKYSKSQLFGSQLKFDFSSYKQLASWQLTEPSLSLAQLNPSLFFSLFPHFISRKKQNSLSKYSLTVSMVGV